MQTFGISTALLTPFSEDGAVDAARLGVHAASLLDAGVDGITLFGTTGEGASVGEAGRDAALDALLAAGVPGARIVLGVAAPSVAGAAAQMRQGLTRGVATFLVAPPFYFRDATEDGLFGWHAGLLSLVPDARIILYHIPQVTGVPLSLPLVARLAAGFPGRIRAIKDSSADWPTAEAFLAQNALPVLVGDERLLHRAAGLGGAGAITGVANLHPVRLQKVYRTATEDAALSSEVSRIVARPVIPALKAVMAQRSGYDGWMRVRPPLVPLPETERAALLAEIG